MIIGHNLMANNAIRNANSNATAASKSMAKLASGNRITTAADDAAGLSISEKMKGQIRGLDKASSNAQDGISLVQTADGALSETTSVLQRMRELAVQSSNDTNTTADRQAIQVETDQLTKQIDNIANTTQFNTKNLLDGTLAGNITGQGSVAQGTASLTTSNVATTVVAGVSGVATDGKVGTHTIGLTVGVSGQLTSSMTVSASQTLASLGVQNVGTLTVGDVGSEAAFGATLTSNSTVQDFMTAVNASGTATATIDQNNKLVIASKTNAGVNLDITDATATGDFVSTVFGGTSAAGTTKATSTNASATNLTVTDTFTPVGSSTAVTTTDRTGYAPTASTTITLGAGSNAQGIKINVGTGGATAATLTVNTLAKQNSVASHTDSSLAMQIGANSGQTMNVSINSMTASALNVDSLDLTTQTGAEAAVSSIDAATAKVSSERSRLGAYQNRLESTINNLGTTSENLTSAESSITDVDMAKEMSTYSKNNILSQAAQAMISQANQQPQQVLQLLR
ncbi:flagellin [Clostridium sp.]|uniref:flagellin N-terminal helical domain-containing protein n=1 Tax=Clostridium sp. TaxID=1506 RepID=UPI0028501E4A|nr:flagellin [Clostridium sp.]MDR3593990.1 flagellin [Clostridium sp.]